jgi:hypothetical protein
VFFAALTVPFVVLVGLDQEIYILSTVFGVLFVGLSDLGSEYKTRVLSLAVVGLFGAVLTLWGFGIGKEAWGWVVVSVLAVTLLRDGQVRHAQIHCRSAAQHPVPHRVGGNCELRP